MIHEEGVALRPVVHGGILETMNATFILAGIAIILFILAFVTKRRFGILGLALFAGSYLAHTWTGAAAPVIEKSGIDFSSLGVPAATIVAVLLTIVPALILLANSPKYSGKWGKFIGSAAFVALAVVLVAPVVRSAFADSAVDAYLDTVVANYSLLVTAGLIAAVVDLFLSRPHRKPGKSHDLKH